MTRAVAFILALFVAAPAFSEGLCALACEAGRHHDTAATNECHEHAGDANGVQLLVAGAGPCHDVAADGVAAVVERATVVLAAPAAALPPLTGFASASRPAAVAVTARGAPANLLFATRTLRI